MSRDSGAGSTDWNRRKVLKTGAAALPAIIAGCTGSSGGGGGDGSSSGSSGDSESSQSTGTTASGSPKTGGTITWGGSVPVPGLDPHRVAAAASGRIFEQITEGLFKLDFEYNVQNHLVKEYTVSDDSTEFTFELREGVTFHNGKELTSEDVLATFERIASGGFLVSGYFDFVESMSAPDTYTFEMTLSEPFAPLLNRMSTKSMHILPKEQAQQERVEEPIGTGPYQFESRELEKNLVMTKHEDYWQDGVPYADEIRKVQLSDDDTRLTRFEAGEVDFINDVPPKDIDSVKGSESVNYSSGNGVPKLLAYVGLNCTKAPFDDKHARLAVDYCIDKEKLVEVALYGHGETTSSPGFPNSPWDAETDPRPQDFEKAEEHLAKSEYDEIDVSFKIPKAYNTLVTSSQYISDWASEVGINLNIQNITWNNWLSNVYSNQEFEATMSTYLGHWYPDFAYHRFLHPDGSLAFVGWENEEYMSLVEEARHTLGVEERAELYHEANQIHIDDRSGHILMYHQDYALAGQDYYKGQMGAPDGMTLRFQDNWLDQ